MELFKIEKPMRKQAQQAKQHSRLECRSSKANRIYMDGTPALAPAAAARGTPVEAFVGKGA
ncbi:hypothetical protein BWQ96_00856 [Gracilariopsis chorda]|uniref:Uncharacterized protein n=1 Tax=Gracilariopsis chorda TaxID=448386 RepID=A0A2V3J586_9FLOR|nr:hypothetical protein BWQ96_00856 [Gracilariopsis chorda]|eukprot:PXF49282.1 hypothetical protein BWQ96_00856 [Gracilariopsis chorda]